jgi:hypothetical protein
MAISVVMPAVEMAQETDLLELLCVVKAAVSIPSFEVH